MGLPERLKAAREARGWTVEQVAEQLRLPTRIIARVESGDLDGLGAPLYWRGYLRSFARLVGVETTEVDALMADVAAREPQLVATGVTPRSEYMIDRYIRPASYIALTALIALPVVWWAASGRLGQELASQRSFDLLPPQATSTAATTSVPATPGVVAPTPLLSEPTELVRASLIALPPPGDAVVVPATEVARADAGSDAEPSVHDGHLIGDGPREAVLTLRAASWVDVLDARGVRVHQALLAPGEWRFRSDGRLSFTIGNSRAATLVADGVDVVLAGSRTSNDVARLDVFANDG